MNLIANDNIDSIISYLCDEDLKNIITLSKSFYCRIPFYFYNYEIKNIPLLIEILPKLLVFNKKKDNIIKNIWLSWKKYHDIYMNNTIKDLKLESYYFEITQPESNLYEFLTKILNDYSLLFVFLRNMVSENHKQLNSEDWNILYLFVEKLKSIVSPFLTKQYLMSKWINFRLNGNYKVSLTKSFEAISPYFLKVKHYDDIFINLRDNLLDRLFTHIDYTITIIHNIECESMNLTKKCIKEFSIFFENYELMMNIIDIFINGMKFLLNCIVYEEDDEMPTIVELIISEIIYIKKELEEVDRNLKIYFIKNMDVIKDRKFKAESTQTLYIDWETSVIQPKEQLAKLVKICSKYSPNFTNMID